ncbi:MAG TPA: flagellar basal-body rod protein FlgF [Firmicutes bacterium]|nr:flagellar basal-body rod protein FlgF [Bacillota bacterium]
MLRGLYAAASGMLARGIWQDITANNLANLTTPGFKRDFPIFKTFADMLASRITDIVPDRADLKSPGLMRLNYRERVPIGTLGMGTDFEGIATDLSQGPLVETGNPLDLAIDGDGFFVVQTPAGERYTRSGSFSLDNLGHLVTQEGFMVMGENGPIALPIHGPQAIKGIEVTETGAILVSGKPVAQLRIVRFQNPIDIVKEGNGLFRLAQGTAVAQVQPQPAGFSLMVKQGFLEMSNSDPITELVSMIECLRAYETNQKAIAFFDQTLEKAVNEVGRG